MRIAFVHEVNYQSKVVFEMHEFPELLAKNGHEVVFLDYPEGEKWGRVSLANRQIETNRSGAGEAVNVVRPPFHVPGTLGRLLFACFGWLWLSKQLSGFRPDVVVLYGVPTNGWQTVLICRRLGVPVIYRMIDLSHGLRKSIFSPLVKIAEKRVVKGCSLVLANNSALADHATLLRGSADKIHVLAPGVRGVDESDWGEPSDSREAVVVFMGTLFRFSGLEWFMRSSVRDDRRLGFKLLVLGDGEARASLEQTARELGIESEVEFRGFVPFADLNTHLAEATLAILPFEHSDVADLALPGKVPQYLVAGLPVVSTPLSGMKSFLGEGEGVSYCATGSAFVDKVRELLGDGSERLRILVRGREALKERASWTFAIASFEGYLMQVSRRH